jgi:hypothetical protein
MIVIYNLQTCERPLSMLSGQCRRISAAVFPPEGIEEVRRVLFAIGVLQLATAVRPMV